MSEHLDEGLLQALLDDELGNGQELSTREHVAACPGCRERYVEIQDANHTLASALALLDPALPGGVATISPAPSITRRRSRWGRVEVVRAAAMVLVFAAAASATIPGSPMREWLAAAWQGEVTALAPVEEARTTSIAESAAAGPVETGVSVDLADGSFQIVLTDAAPELQIRARLIDGSRGAVYATGDAVEARFSTAPGAIRVHGIPAGELRVEIPRAARAASVVIDGRTYLVKESDHLRLIPANESGPAEVLFEVRP